MTSLIYTRKGDKGETSLADGTRVPKDSLRVETYGTLDEINAWVGLARSYPSDDLLQQCLAFFQHRLYNCTACLAAPSLSERTKQITISAEDIRFLESAIDLMEKKTGALTAFILPGGTPLASSLHVARTVCRRAERLMVTLNAAEPIDENIMALINRGSDFLFASARYANTIDGKADVLWNSKISLPQLPSV